MRWYQFKLRKPRRWARRAKSDGSAVPKLNRVSIENQYGAYRISKWAFFAFVPLMLLYGLGVSIYFKYATSWVSDLFPALFSVRASIIVIAVSFALKISFYAWMLVFMIYKFRIMKKHANLAIAHRCHLCPRCGYSLQSRTDDTQPCPECGQRISRREAVRLWARFCR